MPLLSVKKVFPIVCDFPLMESITDVRPVFPVKSQKYSRIGNDVVYAAVTSACVIAPA